MKLDTKHEGYTSHIRQWMRCRSAIAGQDAVHEAGDVYLPRLTEQTDNDFRTYVARATWFNAPARTLEATSGMLNAKPPKADIPAAMTAWVDDITLSGCSLQGFANMCAEELIAVGRVGVIVEHPENEADSLTVSQAEAMNLRPYLRMYAAEAIHDWRTGSVGGAQRLTMVKLFEVVEEQTADEFVTVQVEQYRILDLFEGAYRVRLFRKDAAGEWMLALETFPRFRGGAMRYIPFLVAGVDGLAPDCKKPPLLDLIDTCFAHYRNTADLEHGLHFTGLPTPVISGVVLESGQKYAIGSTTAWVFADPSARAQYLEFNGSGLGELRQAIADKERRMAALGARMLMDDKRAAESTETTDIKTAGERSVLASLSMVCSELMTQALKIMADWAGVSGEPSYTVNREFQLRRLSAQEALAVMQLWQSGAISKEVLFENLQAGGMVSDGREFEDEEERMALAAPQFSQAEPEPQSQGFMASLRERLGL